MIRTVNVSIKETKCQTFVLRRKRKSAGRISTTCSGCRLPQATSLAPVCSTLCSTRSENITVLLVLSYAWQWSSLYHQLAHCVS